MARSGLYKSEVKKARDALLAQNKYPSVDAVRIALGNTGSKTTIHKYLKELEDDDGGNARKSSISEALHDFVARLAAQLQDEAHAQIDAMRTEYAEKDQTHLGNLAAARQEAEQLRGDIKRVETSLLREQERHAKTQEAWQQETITRHTAEQQVTDLKESLAENEAHRLSLEEKHRHAREALEHYRQSIKEQRDQDQRRQEQQVQQLQMEMRQLQQSMIVKQDEVTRLNQEAARLVGDLSHAQKEVYDQQSSHRQLAQKIESLQAVEQRNKVLETLLSEKDLQVQSLKGQNVTGAEKSEELVNQVRHLELALATEQAKIEALQGFVTEFRAFLDARGTIEGNADKLNLMTSG